jgi:hypothetical protein
MDSSDSVARDLASGYLEDNPSFIRVIWCKDSSNVIRFVIVANSQPDIPYAYKFHHRYRNYECAVALVNPLGWQDMIDGKIRIPEQWTLNDKVEFEQSS